MESYYRVESVDVETGECRGGYICAIELLLSIILGVAPGQQEALEKAMEESDDERVGTLELMIGCLTDIPVPEVYKADKANHVCLYTEGEFNEELDLLVDLSYMIEDISHGKYRLHYKYVDLFTEEDIKYEDEFQIVVDRARYEELTQGMPYLDLDFRLSLMESDCEDDFDEF